MCSFNFFRNSVNPMSNLTYTEAAKWLKKKLHNAAVFVRDKHPNSLCCADLMPVLLPNFSVIPSSPYVFWFGRIYDQVQGREAAGTLCICCIILTLKVRKSALSMSPLPGTRQAGNASAEQQRTCLPLHIGNAVISSNPSKSL